MYVGVAMKIFNPRDWNIILVVAYH